MTVTSTDTRIAYAGNGSTTSFAVPFQFFGPDEMRIYSVDADQVETLLERGVHYTVTGGLGATGTLAMGTAPASGTVLVLRRSTTATQQVLLPNAGPLPGPTLERALDRLTAIAQENQASFGRTLRVPAGEADDLPVLPSALARAGKVLAFDSIGDPTAATLDAGTVTVSSAMEPVLAAATLITARSLMGGQRRVDAVRDFGADNTNGSDARAAIQAAIDSLTVGTVYLAPGSYGLASALTPKPYVTLEADDPLLATLVARANSISLVSYTAAAAAAGFAIRRLGFAAGGFSSIKAIALNGVDSGKRIGNVSLEDLYVSGGATGLDLRWCVNLRAENIKTEGTAVGIYIDTCAETEILGGWSQNGSGQGIYVVGRSGAFDEGLRITGYATKNQVKGIEVSGQEWGQIANCSLTGASGGPLAFISAANWTVKGNQLSTGGGSPATPGLSADALCTGIEIAGNLFATNSFGVNLLGSQHLVVGNRFTGNSNVDINLQCTRSAISGNVCHSTGSATSILEQSGSNYNAIAGNVTNGTVTLVGPISASTGANVVY
jgi:hypothetical protein